MKATRCCSSCRSRVSSLAASAQGAVDLITNKRAITTSVLIRDGGTLVLGGLIQDSVTNGEQSVPLLGAIPFLGELFRTRNTQKTKTNFLIFLQPHILRNDTQAGVETDAKYDYIRDQQRKAGQGPGGAAAAAPSSRLDHAGCQPTRERPHRRSRLLGPDADTRRRAQRHRRFGETGRAAPARAPAPSRPSAPGATRPRSDDRPAAGRATTP